MKALNFALLLLLNYELIGHAAEPGKALPDPAKIRPTMYCTGFAFAEGPAIDRDGNLYVVNYRQWGTIGKITPDGAASIFVDLRKELPADGDRLPSANGLKIDDDANLIGAETGTSQVIVSRRTAKKSRCWRARSTACGSTG